MIEKIYNNPWFLRIVALAFSLLLFGYVNFEKNGLVNTNNAAGSLNPRGSEVISNVPVYADVDQNKYYISGLPEKVSVKIEGLKSIINQTVTSQNFKVVAKNLNNLGVGDHTVQLTPEGFSDKLGVSITPSEARIKIENKKVKTFDVSVEFNKALVARGYEAGTPTLDYNTVEISGAESNINKIASVKAVVSVENGVKKDIKSKVTVQVEDADGNNLDVVVNPSEVNVTIPILVANKDIPISLKQTGTPTNGKSYRLGIKGNQTTVNIAGETKALSDYSSFAVNVDVTGITETTTKEIALSLPDGITSVSPETIMVVITVTDESSGGGSGENNGSGATSTSSSSSSSSSSGSSSSSSSSSSVDSGSSSSSESTATSSSESSNNDQANAGNTTDSE
ncbi:CdaR family protein [Carnobacterium gallinarum]|uniref:CdaR family protein n=1 Tax=Carnobacterium gallinarum TaxID=2749 RepID=UPI0006894754|nr:CdaR family protein [Carnobacterium gallinarum]